MLHGIKQHKLKTTQIDPETNGDREAKFGKEKPRDNWKPRIVGGGSSTENENPWHSWETEILQLGNKCC